ncbi:MAG: hypothetical protein K8R48_08480 [Alphaproteobacteria bacterium]|nr:hypothetical protein [Alphaproteobacteria bacterium]
MDPQDIKNVRESDVKRYSRMWDKIKKPKLKIDDFIWSPYSEDNAAIIRDYVALSKISKLYKSYFLAIALEIVLEEAEIPIGESLQDLAHNIRILTRNRIVTAEIKFDEALFMCGLVRHGASANSSFRTFAKWRKLSPTNCRTAYHELKRLTKAYPVAIREISSNIRHEWLLGVKRPFPDDNPKTYQAFEKLRAEIKAA